MSSTPPGDIPPSMRSGETGGPATGLGVEYQTLYSAHIALNLISRLLRENPLQRPLIAIEPRVLDLPVLTRWDLLIDPDRVVVEAKARPSKSDLVEFVTRAIAASTTNLSFELVYGECSVGFLKGLRKLLKLREECHDDVSRFRKWCELEGDRDFNEVLLLLGDKVDTLAPRLVLKPFPEHAVESAIDFQLRYLVPTNQGRHLRNQLIARFLKAMQKREVVFIPTLMTELEGNGIEFADPSMIIPDAIDPAVHQVIFVLQRCHHGLPSDVLVAIASVHAWAELRSKLQTCMGVIEKDGLWFCNPLPARIDHVDGAHLLERALNSSLEFIKQNNSNLLGRAQVENALDLARECAKINPAAATVAFGPLDKLLKRRGRKREVLELADITVTCARRVPGTESTAQCEAKALVCGHCWVHQRIGQFDKAEAFGEESLKIGRIIGWDQNTAFCLKCLGRLKRVRAEQSTNARTKQKLLNDSEGLLLEAIDAFCACQKYGPAHPEVGDCKSLLGRTHLLAGRLPKAAQCASRARELIIDRTSKDYMDLLILEGEIATRQIDLVLSEKKFTEALGLLEPDDFEKSEVAARAYYARGSSRWESTRKAAKCIKDIEAALRIWEQTGDHFNVGVARWKLVEIAGDVPARERVRLKNEPPAVRIEVLRLLHAMTQSKTKATLAQRAELNDRMWREILSQARKNDAIRNARW